MCSKEMEPHARFELATPGFVSRCSGPDELVRRNVTCIFLGVTTENRTQACGTTTHRSAIELWPHLRRREYWCGILTRECKRTTALSCARIPKVAAFSCTLLFFILVGVRGFELAKALLLRQVGVPVSISHRGKSSPNPACHCGAGNHGVSA